MDGWEYDEKKLSKTINEVLCCSLIKLPFKLSSASLPSLGFSFFWAAVTRGTPPSPESSPGHSCCPQRDVSVVVGSGAKWWET